MINLKRIILIAAFILLIVFGFNPLLKLGLEKGGAAAFGAKTEIAGFRLNPFIGNLDIRQLQVANKNAPMTNLFEVGAFRLSLNTEQLFYKRVNIERATIENIRLGTPRKTSGALPGKAKKPEKPKEPFDLNKFAQDMELNPDAVAAAFTVAPPQANAETIERVKQENAQKIADAQKQLAALDVQKELAALNLSELSNLSVSSPDDLKKWQSLFDEKQKGLKKLTASIAANKATAESAIMEARVNLEQLQKTAQQDIDNLLSALDISNYDLGAIGKELLGPKINGWIASGLEYVELAKKHMPPKKTKTEKKPKKEHFKGETIVFPNNKTRPRFWIGHTGLSGIAGAGSNELKYSGVATDIASEQYLVGRPTVIKINGAFTQREQSKMDIDITLDQRQADALHHLYKFFLSGYDLSGVQFWAEQMVPLNITAGLGQLNAVVEINGEEIHGEIILQGRNLRYAKDAQATGIQALVAEAIMSAPELSIQIELTGRIDDPRIWIKTNVDSLIKARLEKEFGDQAAKAKAQVTAEYEKVVGTAQKDLENNLKQQEKEITALFTAQQEALNSEQAKIEAKKKELEDQAGGQVDAVKKQAEDALKNAIPGIKL